MEDIYRALVCRLVVVGRTHSKRRVNDAVQSMQVQACVAVLPVVKTFIS